MRVESLGGDLGYPRKITESGLDTNLIAYGSVAPRPDHTEHVDNGISTLAAKSIQHYHHLQWPQALVDTPGFAILVKVLEQR